MTRNVDGIRDIAGTSKFAASLVEQFDRYDNLSFEQWRWVVKLQMPIPDAVDMDASSIHEMFMKTSTRLKGPRIRVFVGEQCSQSIEAPSQGFSQLVQKSMSDPTRAARTVPLLSLIMLGTRLSVWPQ